MNDHDSSCWHQAEMDQQRREEDELLANDPEYQEWLIIVDGLKDITKQVSGEIIW